MITPLFDDPSHFGISYLNASDQADIFLSNYRATLPEPGVVRSRILEIDAAAQARLLGEAKTNPERFDEVFLLELEGVAVCEISSIDRVVRLPSQEVFQFHAACGEGSSSRVIVTMPADGSTAIIAVSSRRFSYSFLPLRDTGFSLGVEIDNSEVANTSF